MKFIYGFMALSFSIILHIILFVRVQNKFKHIIRVPVLPLPKPFLFTPFEIFWAAKRSGSLLNNFLALCYILSLIAFILDFIIFLIWR